MKISMQLEQKILAVLDFYADRNELIVPDPDPASDVGYVYAGFAEQLDEPDVDEVPLLRVLYERGILSRHIQDRVLLCKECRTHHISLREVCPSCKSLNWRKKPLYHHFSCGYVGTEDEFTARSFKDLYCPKCGEQLRHIGIDYEKPTEPFTCGDCNYIFTEHDTEGYCLNCGVSSSVAELVTETIYSYELTARAYKALELDSLRDMSLYEMLQDRESGRFNLNYVLYMIDYLRMVAQECGDAITVLVAACSTKGMACKYAQENLPPSFIVTYSDPYCLVLATRGGYEAQRDRLLKLVEQFRTSESDELYAGIYPLQLEESGAVQVNRFIEETGQRISDEDPDDTQVNI